MIQELSEMRRLPHRAAAPEQFGSDGSVRGAAGRREGTTLGPNVLDDAAKVLQVLVLA